MFRCVMSPLHIIYCTPHKVFMVIDCNVARTLNSTILINNQTEAGAEEGCDRLGFSYSSGMKFDAHRIMEA